MVDPNVILSRLKHLIEQEFFSSAKSISGLLISSLEGNGGSTEFGSVSSSTSAKLLSQVFFYHAEGLVGLGEFKRSIKYYQSSLNYYKILRLNKVDTSPLISESYVKYRLAKIWFRFNEFTQTKLLLESISERYRSAKVWMLLGKAYESITGESAKAITCYRAVLKENPDAIEALEALSSLNTVSVTEVIASLKVSNNESWLTSLVQAQSLISCHEYDQALDMLAQLEIQFPNNIQILKMIAEANLKSGKSNRASQAYARIHGLDGHCQDGMECYASLLKNQGIGREGEVHELANGLMETDSSRPEPWLITARYLELKDERERALGFVEKAIQLSPRHRECYLVKGGILLGLEKPADACLTYRKAHGMFRDLLSFQGLIESYIAMGREKEALSIAREAVQLMPKNSKILTLVGIVLSHTPNGRERAKKAFENAISLDPHCTEAIIAIVSTSIANKEWRNSIKLLEEHLKFDPSDFLHTRLGDIYSLTSDFGNALMNYNAALNINPNYERAVEGIMRVEKLMNTASGQGGNGSNEVDESINNNNSSFQSLC